MMSKVRAEVTLSLNADDIQQLVEEGELTEDGVTLTLYGEAPKELSDNGTNS